VCVSPSAPPWAEGAAGEERLDLRPWGRAVAPPAGGGGGGQTLLVEPAPCRQVSPPHGGAAHSGVTAGVRALGSPTQIGPKACKCRGWESGTLVSRLMVAGGHGGNHKLRKKAMK